MQFVHFLGNHPLLVALSSKKKPVIAQSLVLILGLSLTVVSILLRPKSPPILRADLIGYVASAFLLAPAVVTVWKLWKAKSEPKEAATG